jgi:hypothetical protein
VTALELVKEEAEKFGLVLSDREADHVAWSETGFPCFWPDATKTPEENMRQQVREWAEKKARKGR